MSSTEVQHETGVRASAWTGPGAPLRLLLIGYPDEFDPWPDPASREIARSTESDRAFLLREAYKIVHFNDGRGAQYLSVDEQNRIFNVWEKEWAVREALVGKEQFDFDRALRERYPPVDKFSTRCYAEIAKAEDRLRMRPA